MQINVLRLIIFLTNSNVSTFEHSKDESLTSSMNNTRRIRSKRERSRRRATEPRSTLLHLPFYRLDEAGPKDCLLLLFLLFLSPLSLSSIHPTNQPLSPTILPVRASTAHCTRHHHRHIHLGIMARAYTFFRSLTISQWKGRKPV